MKFAIAGAAAITALLLAGCATPTVSRSPPPANYAQLAANYLAGNLHNVPVQNAQISALRASKGTQPGQWGACIAFPAAQNAFYAIFYDEGKVIDFRQSVAIDNCRRTEVYVPLPAARLPKAAKPAVKPK